MAAVPTEPVEPITKMLAGDLLFMWAFNKK